jgi:hypothetical protein
VAGLRAALDEAKLAAARWILLGRNRHLVRSPPTSSYSAIDTRVPVGQRLPGHAGNDPRHPVDLYRAIEAGVVLGLPGLLRKEPRSRRARNPTVLRTTAHPHADGGPGALRKIKELGYCDCGGFLGCVDEESPAGPKRELVECEVCDRSHMHDHPHIVNIEGDVPAVPRFAPVNRPP